MVAKGGRRCKPATLVGALGVGHVKQLNTDRLLPSFNYTRGAARLEQFKRTPTPTFRDCTHSGKSAGWLVLLQLI